jgi:hypothetical protein
MRLPPESGQAVPLDGSFRSEPTQAPRRRHSPEALRAGGAQPGRPLCCTRARRGRGRPHVRLRREVVDRGTGEPPWANEPRCCSRRPLSPPRGSKSQRRCAPSPKGSPESARGRSFEAAPASKDETDRWRGGTITSVASLWGSSPSSRSSKAPPPWRTLGASPRVVKALHDFVGAHPGVVEGNGGDLRTGLLMQCVYDGERWAHRPLRLTVFIEAPRVARRVGPAVRRDHSALDRGVVDPRGERRGRGRQRPRHHHIGPVRLTPHGAVRREVEPYRFYTSRRAAKGSSERSFLRGRSGEGGRLDAAR